MYFFWDIVRLVVRILIAIISTEIFENNTVSGLSTIFVLVLYASSVIKNSPFNYKMLNTLEAESVLAASFTIFLSLIFESLTKQENS